MAENFNIDKVGQQVKTEVAKIISGGKVQNAADTIEEYEQLGKLLSGGKYNDDEVGYIKSKRGEYTTKYELQDLRNRATTYAKGIVDKIKNLVKADNKLDAEEAEHMALEAKKAYNEKRGIDCSYILKELRESGFAELAKKTINEMIKY